ncbi:MAG: type II toxin-antitoxin system HicA family toxin [Candidatus Wallbacteria bacterium]|nr:type II toxin-antitoxin system HicA family toxin [Candidatus Wallbacteria bacterium]
MRYREVARKLTKVGCQEIPRKSGGSHRKWKNASSGMTATVPDWGSKDLKEGTVRAVARQLGLDWDKFSQA